jgi:hypothetical protein
MPPNGADLLIQIVVNVISGHLSGRLYWA